MSDIKICTKCKGDFTWKMPYDGSKIPTGDRPCTCTPKQPKAENKSAAAHRVEVPIEQICAEITAIRGVMATAMAKINTNVDGTSETQGATEIQPAPLTSEMIEGIWKFAISRKMSR